MFESRRAAEAETKPPRDSSLVFIKAEEEKEKTTSSYAYVCIYVYVYYTDLICTWESGIWEHLRKRG